jgi:cytidylate kinase
VLSPLPMQRHRALVAIDGPAGAGKSTVARRVAASLGFVLVDTGALYRTVALAATREGLSLGDGEAVGALSERLAETRAIRLVSPPIEPVVPVDAADGVPPPSDSAAALAGASGGGSGVRVLLGEDDVSGAIRTPEVSLAASQVSAHPRVRASLLALQRQAGERGGVVLEGRDIGTVVFPDAEVKFFLTANPTVRATRRQLELEQKGTTVSFADTLAEVVRRDRADSERPIAPLRRADDALLVDSSGRPVEDVVAEMVAIVRAREHELGLGDTHGPAGGAGG